MGKAGSLLSLSLYKICCWPGVSGARSTHTAELHGVRIKRGFITQQDFSIQTQAKTLKTQHLEASLSFGGVWPLLPQTYSVPYSPCCAGIMSHGMPGVNSPTACGLNGLFHIYFNYISILGQCIYFKSHYLQLPKHVSTKRTVSI